MPQGLVIDGEDRIMMEADMPHGEGRETSVKEIRERKDLSDSVKEKY